MTLKNAPTDIISVEIIFKDYVTFNENKKIESYITSFEKTHNVSLHTDGAKFARTLLTALINMHIDGKDDLLRLIALGLEEDGSFNEDAKNAILRKICHELFIPLDNKVIVLNEGDFEMFVELMTLNFGHDLNVRLLANYLKMLYADDGEIEDKTKDAAEFNLLLSLILKNRLLFDSANVVLYPEELDLLNNLSALKCYDLMNKILQLKLNKQTSIKNIFAERLIPGLDDILNSREYKILNNKKINAGDKHINIYYSVFNKPKNLPNDINVLINQMDADLKALVEFNPNLGLDVQAENFMGYNTISGLQNDYPLTFEQLIVEYYKIDKLLNNWRNKEISYQAAV